MNTNDVCKLPPFGGGRGERLPLSSLTKSELAQLYFPGALRRLTRRQVMIIFEYLGEP